MFNPVSWAVILLNKVDVCELKKESYLEEQILSYTQNTILAQLDCFLDPVEWKYHTITTHTGSFSWSTTCDIKNSAPFPKKR